MSRTEAARGDDRAYDRYLAGMDASMRQKVALTAAHLLSVGELADMGMGSGAGSYALARLYPGLRVVGVDLDPAMVARARARYDLPNLDFVTGDMAAPCFPSGHLEAILCSSVLHHVTSFSGYDRDAARRALAVQAEQLAPGGVLVIRDFLDPGPGPVWLDVPADDGQAPGDDPATCSTAALLERFAREFRVLRPPEGRGFPLADVTGSHGAAGPPLRSGWRRYALDRVHAVEFVLRKDYRADWALEVQEEYTFLTQPDFEAVFTELGLRVLASTPIRNPWIVSHRFEGRFALWDAATGEALDWPATNYVIVGQRVGGGRGGSGAGVAFTGEPAAAPLGYLELTHWRHIERGTVYDLVRRPGVVVDVLPWFERDGVVHVLARRSYPRPILGVAEALRTLSGGAAVTWVSEPLNAILGDKPIGQAVEELLMDVAGVGEEGILTFERGSSYYPSPGGVQEEVRSVHVAIEPLDVTRELHGRSGFSTSGVLRAIEARQLLRAAQVGGLPDARLELHVYDLLIGRGLTVGPWIGAALAVEEGEVPPDAVTLSHLLTRPGRRRFRRADPEASAGFLDLVTSVFVERDAAGREVTRQALEYVIPAQRAPTTVAVACLRRHHGELWLGVDDDDLPASQCFDGDSALLVTPAWRLPWGIETQRGAEAFIRERLAAEYGATVGPFVELGGRYHPSPGVTPEVVYPWSAAVLEERTGGSRLLTWVRLCEVVALRERLRDGHLRAVALRAAHAAGILP